MTYARETIQTMVDFILALLPILLALIATGEGCICRIFHPIIIFLMNTSGLLMNYIVLPLLLLATILSIVSTMSDHIKLRNCPSFCKTLAWGLSVSFNDF